MRSGPLVRRGAQISRALQNAPVMPRRRVLATSPAERAAAQISPPIPLPHPIIETSCLHAQCKLPINLREFLAHQFGVTLESDNDAILALAANADDAMLSKVARAIRRYSTNRAREAWDECARALKDFETESVSTEPRVALCLACARIDFGADADRRHNNSRCLTIDFTPACAARDSPKAVASIPDRLQRRIEEFRAMRSAFGLPHFDLDCYVASRRVMFSWRPVGVSSSAHANF